MLKKLYFISGYYMSGDKKLDFWFICPVWFWQSPTYAVKKIVERYESRGDGVPMIQQVNRV